MGTTVAAVIVEQIGRKALYMLGAKDLMGDEKSLTFRVGRNAKSVSHLRITLDPSDTYTVEAIRVRKLECKTVASSSDVYVDALHTTIEALTGLYTRL